MKKIITIISATFFIAINSFSQNTNVTFRSHLAYPGQTCANICGYVDSVGNEYALVGAAQGMSIVDVTNPDAPVEVLQVPNIDDEWKEIKVRGKYAYVTTEGGGGLQIVNLSSLPNVGGITYKSWKGDGAIAGQLNTIHALHIDNNFVYLYGSNLFNGGAVVADITDPWNPTYAGKYEVGTGNAPYVHDGYVRNDTLYAGHIYSGYFSVVDFTDKSNPIEITNQYTPSRFTHNTWLSTDSKTLFTTDEVGNSFLTSYDLSNLPNTPELDRIQSNPGSNSIVHNTHILQVAGNDYAVTSWYHDGFNIVDAGRPSNLVIVGNYDTSPCTGNGFDGAWGVYPFLPSGNIVVSNIDEGLYVFTPTYVRACYLEGTITDAGTGFAINGAKVEILSTTVSDFSKITGDYATGIPAPGGTYSIRVSKAGYDAKTITGVVLTPAQVTNLNVTLSTGTTFAYSGQVKDVATTLAIDNASVLMKSGNYTYQTTTDASGNFTYPAIYADNYDITIGKWGYENNCSQSQSVNSSSAPLSVSLTKGYHDDFTFDFGWTVFSTASTGRWARVIPYGTNDGCTPANAGTDDSTDCNTFAYITGNTGTDAADDDIDNGFTRIISPAFDLSTYIDPYIDFSHWFYNAGGSGTPNDSISIFLNNGTSTVLLDFANHSSLQSEWVHKSFKISNYITPTATMKAIVRAVDASPGHIVEAGFDNFLISEGPTGIIEQPKLNSQMMAYPNPFTNEITITYELKNKFNADASLNVYDAWGRVVCSYSLVQANGKISISPTIISGIYFVKITNGNEHIAPVKIMKMN